MDKWMSRRRAGRLSGRNLLTLLLFVALVTQSGCATYKPWKSPCTGDPATKAQCSKWIQLTPLSRVWTGFDNPEPGGYCRMDVATATKAAEQPVTIAMKSALDCQYAVPL